MRGDQRAGAVLLEVLIAMTIFAVAASAALARAAQARHAVVLARAAEARIVAASAFMDRVALWPREDLDRHLGQRAEGPWSLEVERPSPDLYMIALRDSSRRSVLLRTAVYRAPEHP